MPFVVIFTILNMNRIFLTKQGRIEKARIIQYKKSLKNKIDLTAREKLFLELLQK